MAQPLALAYRPAQLGDLSGQHHVATVLGSVVARHRAGEPIPATWLFTGPPGTGKTSTARMLAAALASPDGYDWTPAAIVEVDAATNNGVDAVRELVQLTAYATAARHRTIVMDECHALSSDAWQALLKALEQPAPDTTWVLVTTEATKVPDPVLSRSIDLRFRAIDSGAVRDRLAHICWAESIPAEPEALELIARRSSGGMRDAIMALDQLRLTGSVTVAAYEAVYGVGHAAPAYLDAIRSGDLTTAMAVATAYAAGTGEPALLVDEALELLADQLASGAADVRSTVAGCRVLWEARARLRAAPLGARAALGAVTAELATALGAPLRTPTAQVPATAADLSLALAQAID